MCMFQGVKVKPTNRVVTGYKSYDLLSSGNPISPLQYHRAPIGKWVVAGNGEYAVFSNPGFNVFKKRMDSEDYNLAGKVTVKVSARKVVSRSLRGNYRGDGFCAMELRIDRTDWINALEKYDKEQRTSYAAKFRAFEKRSKTAKAAAAKAKKRK